MAARCSRKLGSVGGGSMIPELAEEEEEMEISGVVGVGSVWWGSTRGSAGAT